MKKILTVLAAACLAAVMFVCGCAADGRDGRDGTNGHDVTIDEIYEKYKQEYGDVSYADFLKEYLNYTNAELDELTGLKSKINKSLMSGVTILSTFDYTIRQSGTHLITGSSFTIHNVYTGSGAILWLDKEAGDAFVVTNCHVIYDDTADADNIFCKDVRLYLYGQDESGVNFNVYKSEVRGYENYEIKNDEKYCIKAEVVGASVTYDIALLKIEGSEVLKRSNATVAEFSDQRDVTVGQTVYTVGNASGEGMSASNGIISKDSELIRLTLSGEEYLQEEDYLYYRVMRVTAPINPGNSGGALYDKDGKIIGVVNAKDEEEGIDNMGYALPGDSVKRLLQLMYDDYKANGPLPNHKDGNGRTVKGGIEKAFAGVTTLVSDSYSQFNESKNEAEIIQHVRVNAVGSAPAKGNVKEGDYLKAVEIIGADGKVKVEKFDITRDYHLREVMLSVRMGDTVNLTVERNNELLELALKFDSAKYFSYVE